MTASLEFSVAVFEATEVNRAPLVVGTIAADTIEEGRSAMVDAASYFSDPDGDDLEFTAASSGAGVASARVSGAKVTVRAVAQRAATVTITATDPGDSTATQAFSVTVSDSAEAPRPVALCEDGYADEFPCRGVDLMSRLTPEEFDATGIVNDIWVWTDPATGTEWALVGRSSGTSFISLEVPEKPVYAGRLPMTSGATANYWRDIKVYKEPRFRGGRRRRRTRHAGIRSHSVAQCGKPAPDFSATRTYTRIQSAHDIVINEATGFACSVGGGGGDDTCGGGLHMIDISKPSAPKFTGCFAHDSTGRRGTGYTHDAMCVVYRGPDTEHRNKDVCFGANETDLSIADVSDKDDPVALASASYPNVEYAHQGWLDGAHEYFYMNDELDEYYSGSRTRTLVWDVKDLDDPVVVKEFTHNTSATDHNLYGVGDLMYQSNYNAGLRILSIADRKSPVEIAFFDTEPGQSGGGFDGSWSNYPFFASGVIAVTSQEGGVFFVKRSKE